MKHTDLKLDFYPIVMKFSLTIKWYNYSHGQELFYKFVSNFTNKLGKTTLVTYPWLYNSLTKMCVVLVS